VAHTYDLSTDVGRVRLLISDVPDVSEPANPAVFTDEEIETFLDLRGDNVKLAAATALRSLGGNAVLLRGKLRMLDLSTDAPAESEALAKLADRYEAEADAAGVTAVVGGQEADTTTGFVIL
jgi:hypothetical protein